MIDFIDMTRKIHIRSFQMRGIMLHYTDGTNEFLREGTPEYDEHLEAWQSSSSSGSTAEGREVRSIFDRSIYDSSEWKPLF